LDNLKKFYINGEWIDSISSNTLAVINPATEVQIGSIAMGGKRDVDAAVSAANIAFKTFSNTSKEERLELLKNLRLVTQRRFEELAQAITLEMGAPITMSRDAQADAAIGH
jgi:aldehyde dehydrogenase (NAD+)